jgi:hypothetical protein
VAKMPSGFTTVRDAVSFTIGAGILLYAIVIQPPPPETVSVGVGLALVGLPATSLMGGNRAGRNDKSQ